MWVTYPADEGRQNSIVEHGELLAAALREQGTAAMAATPEVLRSDLAPDDVVWLQYNPFAYGRWGVAPRLVLDVERILRRPVRPRVCLFIHEPYVPLRLDRMAPAAVWQREQLRRLVRRCDLVIGATERWCAMVRRLGRRDALFQLPVGSALPDRRAARDRMREELGIAAEQLVVAQFGTDHPTHLNAHALAALEALEQIRLDVAFLNLGQSSRPLARVAGARQIVPGYLDRDALARHLAAADIFLSPLVDGVSTRRTSLIAALQHGVPCVGTERRDTDSILRGQDGLLLAPAENVERFASLVVGLARDGASRTHASAEARSLFDQEFAWNRIARRAVEILNLSPGAV